MTRCSCAVPAFSCTIVNTTFSFSPWILRSRFANELSEGGARRTGRSNCLPRIPVALVVVAVFVLAGLSLSCGSSSHGTSGPNHNAYVTLPSRGSVLLLHINGATGAITLGAETPQVENTSPTGIALLPSKKFLYAINSSSFADSISIFNVASDGTLALSGTPTPAGNGPNDAVIDPSGKYLLVTNNFGNNVSVYSIDAEQRRFVGGCRVAVPGEFESSRDSDHAFGQIRLRDQSGHRDGHRFFVLKRRAHSAAHFAGPFGSGSHRPGSGWK